MRVLGPNRYVGITSVSRRYCVGAQRSMVCGGILGIFDKKEAGLSSELEGAPC